MLVTANGHGRRGPIAYVARGTRKCYGIAGTSGWLAPESRHKDVLPWDRLPGASGRPAMGLGPPWPAGAIQARVFLFSVAARGMQVFKVAMVLSGGAPVSPSAD